MEAFSFGKWPEYHTKITVLERSKVVSQVVWVLDYTHL